MRAAAARCASAPLGSPGRAAGAHPVLQALHRGLVVSCQPVTGGALDHDAIVLAFAQAARDGGAAALRIEGAPRVARVARALALPVIGIVKRDLDSSPVRITPWRSDVQALADAGASVIAVDATDRPRPCAVAELLAQVHEAGALAMADCATEAEARAAAAMGFDIVGTTLSGYIGPGPVPSEPDLALVTRLADPLHGIGCPLMAEGRFNTPAQARSALAAGAWAVTVGSAITRPEWITGWFVDALRSA